MLWRNREGNRRAAPQCICIGCTHKTTEARGYEVTNITKLWQMFKCHHWQVIPSVTTGSVSKAYKKAALGLQTAARPRQRYDALQAATDAALTDACYVCSAYFERGRSTQQPQISDSQCIPTLHLDVPSDSKVSVYLSNANLLWETEETGLYCNARWLLHVPQSTCTCSVRLSEQQRLFPYTALTDWVL